MSHVCVQPVLGLEICNFESSERNTNGIVNLETVSCVLQPRRLEYPWVGHHRDHRLPSEDERRRVTVSGPRQLRLITAPHRSCASSVGNPFTIHKESSKARYYAIQASLLMRRESLLPLVTHETTSGCRQTRVALGVRITHVSTTPHYRFTTSPSSSSTTTALSPRM